ncbi:DnaJ protein [Coprinopsis cinerea AmutBmut pab1-1]|nr:DnaJ protein [Coprinopsis cinerea AmutBmut pab1-1]
MPFARASRILPRSCPNKRQFSTTAKRLTHYQTLGLPQDASKAQIKSHFYRLSKQHHPDLSKDPKSREAFSKINEAYQVLINDRDRRAYDRSLMSRGPPLNQGHTPYSPHAPPPRTPRATHAWEYTYSTRTAKGTYTHHARSTGGFKKPQPDYDLHGNRAGPGGAAFASRPFTRPLYYDVLTGQRKREEDFHREVDKVRNTSMTWRATQISAFIMAGISIFGGFGLPAFPGF